MTIYVLDVKCPFTLEKIKRERRTQHIEKLNIIILNNPAWKLMSRRNPKSHFALALGENTDGILYQCIVELCNYSPKWSIVLIHT